MTAPLSHAVPVVIIGSTEDVRTFLFGQQDHNEHCKSWRWHRYIADDSKRWESVKAELQLMWAERRARLAELEGV